MPCSEADTHSKRLTLRDSTADDGTRPLADGTAYWESPDLFINGGIDPGTAKVGADNHIMANVHNETQAPISNINLEVWVCDYTMGINPSSALASSNPGGAPMTGFASGPIPAGGNLVVDCGIWHPVPADASLNGGHVCIAGNCYGDGDGAPFSGSDFKFLCDCHHGQHNIAVVQLAMNKIRDFHFQMIAANPFLRQDRAETFITLNQPTHKQRPALYPVKADIVFRGDSKVVKPGVTWALLLKHNQKVPMLLRLAFDPKEKPGSKHLFHLTQATGEGEVVGGATLVVELTP